MNDDTENVTIKIITKLKPDLGHPLARLLVAGLIASLITFILLFLMRYLIMGYDRSATEAITQYFTLRTIDLSEGKDERPERVARPGERPEISGMDDPDLREESEAFLEEHAFDVAPLFSPQQEIEKEFQLPQLEAAPLSTQEKLRQIKQKLLSAEDSVEDSP